MVVAEQDRAPVGVDVRDPDDHVAVRCAELHADRRVHRACPLHRLRQHIGGECLDVRLLLLERARISPPWEADASGLVVGAVGWVRDDRGAGAASAGAPRMEPEAPTPVQEVLRRQRWDRPVSCLATGGRVLQTPLSISH